MNYLDRIGQGRIEVVGEDMTITLNLKNGTSHFGDRVEQIVCAGFSFDTIIDLDATAPLRIPEDIAGALRLLDGSLAANIITGSPARRSPYFNLVKRGNAGVVSLSNTLPDCVDCAAAGCASLL